MFNMRATRRRAEISCNIVRLIASRALRATEVSSRSSRTQIYIYISEERRRERRKTIQERSSLVDGPPLRDKRSHGEAGTRGGARACLPIIKFKSTQRKTKRLFSRTGWKLRNASSSGNAPFVYKTYCPGMIADGLGG